MNFREILDLMPRIPQDSRHFRMLILSDGETYGARQDEVELFSACYKDAAFRWHFVRSYIDEDLPLPDDVQDAYIVRLHNFMLGTKKDRFMSMAIALDKHLPPVIQTGIKAMLLDPEADYKAIAATTGIEAMAIKLYEKVFFNIRDRLTEHAYIATIPYPEGRMDTLTDKESYTRNSLQEIVRAGYNNGLEHAAYAMGLKNDMVTEDFGTFAKKLENLFMSNAHWLAKNGFMDSFHPGIQHAKQIIAAAKQGDGDTESEEEVGASLLGVAMAEEVTYAMQNLTQERKVLLKEIADSNNMA